MKKTLRQPSTIRWHWLYALAILLAACNRDASATTVPPATESAAPATQTEVIPPTATEETALAALVNEEPITLSDYESEVARFEAEITGMGHDLSAQGDYHTQVLNRMIDDLLMIQAARLAGYSVDDSEIDAIWQQSIADLGGEQAFNEWLAFSQLTAEQYRQQTYAQLLIGKMVAEITSSVPDELPQVHARHILVTDEATANELLARLNAGEDFVELAGEFSRDPSTQRNGGDLDWFPAGVFPIPEVEQAAFGLEPDQISPVIRSFLGYHIVQTLEKSDARPLSPEVRNALQRNAIQDWLSALRTQAIVERYIPAAGS